MAVAARRLTTSVEVRLVYVGHATVLIEFPWMRVLTDPFFGLRLGPLRRLRWDGIIWYSPTIFLGPAVAWLKRASRCRAYLILRDLFPDWAVDAGVDFIVGDRR